MPNKLKPPIDKLPLAARKNMRDEWDNEKEKYDQELSNLLGEPWSFTVEPLLVYANVGDKDYKIQIGTMISHYVKSFNSRIKEWLSDFGDDGKQEFNRVCWRHTVEFRPQEETDFYYAGIEIVDGLLRLVYTPDLFAHNIDSSIDNDVVTNVLQAAIDRGDMSPQKTGLSIKSRLNIREEWDPDVESIRTAIGKIVGLPDVKLDPNFEKNAAELETWIKSGRDERGMQDYLDRIGWATKEYFLALKDNLKEAKFGEDDMMQEAIKEAISAETVGIRIVKSIKKQYNEVVFEDGVLWIQVPHEDWVTNIFRTGDAIEELL